MKWLGFKPRSRDARAVQQTEGEWRRCDQPSLFLLVTHHHLPKLASWPSSLGTATYNSLTRIGFASGWTLPLRDGPQRHPLLDGGTISEFVTIDQNSGLRRLAKVDVRETYAWDGHYRSDIYATGFFFSLSVREEAMDVLTEKIRVGEFVWMSDSILCSFAVRVPIRREFAFPEPRATEKPYSEGPYPQPLRDLATFGAAWIEVAALDSKGIHSGRSKDLPISDLFADTGPIRLSLGE